MDFVPFLEAGGQPQPEQPCRVAVIPAGLEATVSWLGGAGQGPAAICRASDTLELLDEELLQETWKVGISTYQPLGLAGKGLEAALARIREAVAAALAEDRLPVVLGGEHTVTVGAVGACHQRYPDLHVLQVDAHLDLRQEYDATPWSHACVMRRLDDMGVRFTQVGIRSFCREEWELVQARGWQPWTMARLRRTPDWQQRLLTELPPGAPLYVTVDVDGLDPAVIPATGTPEPGGLGWYETLELLAAVARNRRVVGFDVVELAPAPGAEYGAYAAAKLVYRLIGYIAGAAGWLGP